MSEPVRIRARVVQGTAEVQVLMPHPMETGLRRDERGEIVAAHHIDEVRVMHVEGGDRVVLAVRMSIAVAQHPLLAFRFRGAQAGDRLRVEWVDNRGERRRDQAVIA